MNILLVLFLGFIIGSICLILGYSDKRLENPILNFISKMFVWLGYGVFAFCFIVVIVDDVKDTAVGWDKEEIRVYYNEGDDDYYYFGKDGYEHLEFIEYTSDFRLLKNDSAVIYIPQRQEWLDGLLYLPADKGDDSKWVYRYNDDLVYEMLLNQGKTPAELKEQPTP